MKKFALLLVFLSFSTPHSIMAQNSSVVRDEHVIYVPYDKLDKSLGPENQGVVLPYEEFLKLWGKLPLETPTPTEEPPPVEATLADATYNGRLQDDVAIFQAILQLKALKKGWSKIELPFEKVNISQASLTGTDLILAKGPKAYELILPDRGDYQLSLTFATPIHKQTGEHWIDFELPSAPVSRFSLLLPEKEIKVKVKGDAAWNLKPEGANQSRLSLELGSNRQVHISWFPKPKEITDVKPVIFAETHALVEVEEGFVHTTTDVTFTILKSSVEMLVLSFPKSANLLYIKDKGHENYEIEDKGNEKYVTIYLFEKVESFKLSIGIEQSITDKTKPYPVPFVHAQEVERETGWVGLARSERLQIRPENLAHLQQVNTDNLKDFDIFKDRQLFQSFSYLQPNIQMRLIVEPVKPVVTANVGSVLTLNDKEILYDSVVSLEVEKTEIFSSEVMIPSGFEVLSVSAEGLVDSFRVNTVNQQNVLTIDYTRGFKGNLRLELNLRKEMANIEGEQNLAFLQFKDVKKETGCIALKGAPRLKINTQSTEGLLPIGLKEVSSYSLTTYDGLQMAFRYQKHPISMTLKIEARETKLLANVLYSLNVEEDQVKIRADIGYDILYAGVSELAFEGAPDVEIEGNLIKEKTSTDAENGRKLWKVLLQQPVLGDYHLYVTWYVPLESQKGSGQFDFQPPLTASTDRETGFIAITKATNIEVVPEVENLEAIDPKELPDALKKSGIFLAFKYLAHPFQCHLTVKKPEYEEIINMVIRRAHVEMVVSQEKNLRAEVYYQVRHNGRQYLELSMPENSQIYSVFVNGQGERASTRKSDGRTLIPLTKTTGLNRDFWIKMVYDQKLGSGFGTWGRLKLVAPVPQEAPVWKTTWRLFIPEDYRYFPPGGNMFEQRYYYLSMWNYGKDFLETIIPIEGVGESGAVNEVMQDDFQPSNLNTKGQGGEGGFSPLDVQLVKEGIIRLFYNHQAESKIVTWYVGKKLFSFLDFLIFVAALAVSLVLPHRGIAPAKRLIGGLIGGSVLLMLFSHPFYLSLLASIFWGALIAAIVMGRRQIVDFFQRVVSKLRWEKKEKEFTAEKAENSEEEKNL